MISVIIPVYNVENYLPKCIESILSQSYQDFEAIFVIDGSPDKCYKICQSYAEKDSRIRIINKENEGVSKARNVGIQEAKGDWIVFIDSDDWVTPDYLSTFNVRNANNIDLIISGIEIIDNRTGNIINNISYNDLDIEEADFSRDFLPNKLFFAGHPIGKAFRRSTILRSHIFFDEHLSFHEDHIFVLDYLLHCKCIRLRSMNTYNYRVYHSTSSLSTKRHHWKALLDSSIKMLDRLQALSQKFQLNESSKEFRHCISFCYGPMFSAVFSLYDLELNRNERRNVLSKILFDKKNLYKGLISETLKSRFILIMICKMPFCITDLFFLLVRKYRNRKK